MQSGPQLGPLRRAKLRALVRDGLGGGPGVAGAAGVIDGALPGGAWLHDPGTGAGWVLVDDGAVSSFGAASAWAWRSGVDQLTVLVEGAGAAAIIARRAVQFARPPVVWEVRGRSLCAVSAAPAVAAETSVEAAWDGLAEELRSHGVDVVRDGSSLRGEVLGLEVARAVPDGDAGDDVGAGGGWRLDVGVGHHDREARQELRPNQPVGDALDDVVALVRAQRVPCGIRHPATTLARAGWLRAVVMASPTLVGAAGLVPVAPPLPPGDLRRSGVAVAVGSLAGSGTPVVVVCSTGIDLDLVPSAADARALQTPGASLVIVVPEGDDHPVTRGLAASLEDPAEVRTVTAGWSDLPT